MRPRARACRGVVLCVWLGLGVSCGTAGPGVTSSAPVARGRLLAEQYGCPACHAIPGARVTGSVGPSLRDLVRRTHLAGGIPHTPERLVEWLQAPERVRPGTLMPNMGVTPDDAEILATFLYSLK